MNGKKKRRFILFKFFCLDNRYIVYFQIYCLAPCTVLLDTVGHIVQGYQILLDTLSSDTRYSRAPCPVLLDIVGHPVQCYQIFLGTLSSVNRYCWAPCPVLIYIVGHPVQCYQIREAYPGILQVSTPPRLQVTCTRMSQKNVLSKILIIKLIILLLCKLLQLHKFINFKSNLISVFQSSLTRISGLHEGKG